MRLTKKQEKELEILREWIDSHEEIDWAEWNEEDQNKFFEWSEHGKYKELTSILTQLPEGRTYFHALYWAKKWRERVRDPKNKLT